MNVLSVVCARAGSKGLKNKCIQKLNDKMVVQYAIDYSRSLGENVKTVVSTDIEGLVSLCNKEGVSCIRRRSKLCEDSSKIEDTLADAVEKFGKDCDLCSLVYGNIPTRYKNLFYDAATYLNKNHEYDAVFSMQNVEKYHPAWMFDFNTEVLPKEREVHYRRQMLPQMMIHDGHTILFRLKGFMDRYCGATDYDSSLKYSIFGNCIKPLINDHLIIDIDTSRDLKLAAAVLSKGLE